MSSSITVSTLQVQSGIAQERAAEVISEAPVSLTVNGQTWLTFMCTPTHLDALALGFLFNEGVIGSMDDVEDTRVCEHNDNVDIWLKHEAEQPRHWKRTSGCTGGVSAVDLLPAHPVTAMYTLSVDQVTGLMTHLLESQSLYRLSGGVHTSALCDGEKMLIVSEDIGRHNTLDKIAGLCLIKNIWPEQRILLTTGRISSEMLQKAARMNVGIVISRTAPSSLSYKMAQKTGITLIGYARKDRLRVYTHSERILVTNRS
ncbi:MAG: formate dehydrogenase accessory sulfurtransferase FdhD [Chloroflexota bacterium]